MFVKHLTSDVEDGKFFWLFIEQYRMCKVICVKRSEYSKAKDLINKSEIKYYVSAYCNGISALFDEYICNRVDDIFIDQSN